MVILCVRPNHFFSHHMSSRINWLGRIRITDRRRHHRRYRVLRKSWTPQMEADGYNALTRGESSVWRFDLLEQPDQDRIANQEFDFLKTIYKKDTMNWIHIAMTWNKRKPHIHLTICFKDKLIWEQVWEWAQTNIHQHLYHWRRIWGDPVYSLWKLRYPNGSKFIKQWSKGLIDFGRPTGGH